MEPGYSDWKVSVNAHNQKETVYCPYCGEFSAQMMIRYYTNNDLETERQYRVHCPVCNNIGKTYLHKSVAEKSWEVRENDPPKEDLKPRRRSIIPW